MKQKTVNQNHVEIIAKAGNTTEDLVKSRLEEYTWVNMFSVKQAYEMLELQAEQLQATVDELKNRCEELEKYARHKPNCARLQRPFGASVTVCNASITCTCGLDKLINPSQT